MTIEELYKAFTKAVDEMIEANADTARKWAGMVGPLIEQAAEVAQKECRQACIDMRGFLVELKV